MSTTSPATVALPDSGGRGYAMGLLLFLLTAALFWPATGYQFINMDDDVYVTANHQVLNGLTGENIAWAFSEVRAGFWHPLTWLSLQADAALWGGGAAGFHRTNVLLHAANVVLIFCFLRLLTGSFWRSAAVAALSGFHPLRVEAVAWVSERKELLGVFFGLLSLVFYVRHAQRSQAGHAEQKGWRPRLTGDGLLSLVLFVCGLMSKPMIVTLPALILLLDAWPLQRFSGFRTTPALWRVLLEKAPFILLAMAAAHLTLVGNFHAVGASGVRVVMLDHPLALRLQNAAMSVVVYLGQTFWPSGLVALYPYPDSYAVWKPICAALGLCAVSVGMLRLGRHWLTGWFWYLIALSPVVGIIQVGPHAHADRYVYLPLVGIFLLVVWSVGNWSAPSRARRIFAGLIAVAVLSACAARTRDQLGHWRDSGTLFAHTTRVTSRNFLAEALLANHLASQGRPADAAQRFENAVAWRPDYADAWNGLGLAKAALGRTSDAVDAFHKALDADGGHVGAWNNLGLVLMASGQTNEAVACYHRALQHKPDEPAALNNLGQALSQQQKFVEAIAYCERAVAVRPDEAGFRVNLAAALGNAGRMDEAIAQYRKALQLSPHLEEVRKFLQAAGVPDE